MSFKTIPMASVLLTLHCSAEQNGPMTQVKSRRALDTEFNDASEVAVTTDRPSSDVDEKNTPGVVQKSVQLPSSPEGRPSGNPAHEHDANPTANPVQANPVQTIPKDMPAQNPPPAPSPSPSQPPPAPQAPVKPAEVSQPPAKDDVVQNGPLPDVVIDSDKALTPLASLAGPGAGPIEPEYVQGIFQFLSSLLPDGPPGYLSCSTTMKLSSGYYSMSYMACRQLSESGDDVAVRPAYYSWKFTLTNCPGLTFDGNFDGPACSRRSLSTCAPVVPATRIRLNGTDLDTCLSRGSQLIYSVVNKRTGKTTDQILDLVKKSTP